MSHESVICEILTARGIIGKTTQEEFLRPDYAQTKHDPFLLPDMDKAVERLALAKKQNQKVVIYGDYDIDGLTATTLLLDAFNSFGITVSAFIPNRFIEGYGLSKKAIEDIAAKGADLIVTVDCGSLSFEEIALANKLGVDVVVTDHHSVADTMPDAVAVINPKRLLSDHPEKYADFVLKKEYQPANKFYPFVDLAGVGVAFKLVQALQTRLEGLDEGQEKWLLDLVAFGTVCDVVSLRNENRANVRWGLEVIKKTRRPGLRALMAVSRVKPLELNARSLGFALGPRVNAAGRLETAQLSLDLLRATDSQKALGLAEQLDIFNTERRAEQDRIFKEAMSKAIEFEKDPVLVLSDQSWSHGIIGIVAAKLLEKYYKPTFVLQELDDGTAKGSARSFGDFSAVEAIRATEKYLIKGGGHKLAAGVTIETASIRQWRQAINDFYKKLQLQDQRRHFLPVGDITVENLEGINESLVVAMESLEPYGNGNPMPVFCIAPVTIISRRVMGADNQHVKYTVSDKKGKILQMVAFNKSAEFVLEPGDVAKIWIEIMINEWNGRRSVEGRLLRLESL